MDLDLQSKYRLIHLKTQTSNLLLNTVVLDLRSKCNNLNWKTQLKLDWMHERIMNVEMRNKCNE